jgi:hypothetical protein
MLRGKFLWLQIWCQHGKDGALKFLQHVTTESFVGLRNARKGMFFQEGSQGPSMHVCIYVGMISKYCILKGETVQYTLLGGVKCGDLIPLGQAHHTACHKASKLVG